MIFNTSPFKFWLALSVAAIALWIVLGWVSLAMAAS
mgnify:CR=1 FL=1